MEPLLLWLTLTLNIMAPTDRHHYVPEAQETVVQAEARRIEIASGILTAAFNSEDRPLFGGEYGRSRTALFVVTKMYYESGFRRDVQYGLARDHDIRSGFNDHGRSWCLGQIMLGVQRDRLPNGTWVYTSARYTDEGWTGLELVSDTAKCATTTLHIIKKSFSTCRHLPFEQRLAAYAAGRCNSEIAQNMSEHRFSTFRRFWMLSWPKHPKITDTQALAELAKDNLLASN
jgi:hypothetical protein